MTSAEASRAAPNVNGRSPHKALLSGLSLEAWELHLPCVIWRPWRGFAEVVDWPFVHDVEAQEAGKGAGLRDCALGGMDDAQQDV
ncbi:hypothetical protein, partial [Pannonibacter carbonis]|uniref:hypothetical protein n=1 Tax=Pannonibacter carbonis TaxID=2067569 RepID=UPI001AD8B4DB